MVRSSDCPPRILDNGRLQRKRERKEVAQQSRRRRQTAVARCPPTRRIQFLPPVEQSSFVLALGGLGRRIRSRTAMLSIPTKTTTMAHGVVRCVVRLPPSSLGSQWRRRRSFVSTLKQQRQRQSSSVCIVEVGPRDGLQNENSSSVVSVANKVELILRLMDAGCRTLEVASLVSPRMVPTMANSPEVLHELQEWRRRHTQTTTLQERQQQQDHPNDRNVKFSCLVPSLKYWPAALHAKVDEIAIFASASETFSQKVR